MPQSNSTPYQALARRYRPQSFQEVIGQNTTTETLIHALQQQRLHHAYLFTGTRGVGKTTIARILAKCLNCETGITATPCNQCQNCHDINHGCSIDLLEVDAASRTKVEETRELLDNISYAPNRCRFKIYLIDEVHMLSKHSFNALLKTIEEPPAHVKFLFATTDPHKIPATIISRCLQFHLRHVDLPTLGQHLTNLLSSEQISAEPAAIQELAQAACGSVRDSLSLLDQAIAHSNGDLTLQQVHSMLGLAHNQAIEAIFSALKNEDCDKLLDTCRQLLAQSTDAKQLLDQLLSSLHAAAIAQTLTANPSASTVIKPSISELSLRLSGDFSAQQIQVFYQTLLLGKRDLELAPTTSIGLEMTLLRALAFIRHRSAPAPLPAASDQTTAAPAHSSISAPKAATGKTSSNSQARVNQAAAQTKTIKAPAAGLAALQDWNQALIDNLQLNGAARALAQQCAWHAFTQGELTLVIDKKHKTLCQKTYITRIEQALSQYAGQPIQLTIQPKDKNNQTESVQQQQQIQQQNLHANLLDSAHKDPFIQTAKDVFCAEVIDKSLHKTD